MTDTETPMLKVGDTIWRFDENRRKYDKSGMGGRIIYREHFTSHQIGGETKQSWLITDLYGIVKVNKKTMHEAGKNGFGGHQWFTADGMEGQVWERENKYKIRDLVDRADVETLKKIAALIGYQPQ